MRSTRWLVSFLVACLGSVAQAQPPEAGRLLVASPSLDDPNFGRTVLLLLRHDDDGSAAVALNRPTWIDPAEAFPNIEALSGYGGTLFFGGPIAPSQLIIVFDAAGGDAGNALQVLGSIYVSSDLAMLGGIDSAAAGAPMLRLFAGHAEWGPGQLEAEVEAGNWRVVPAEPARIFTDEPTDLWQRLPPASDAVTASLR